MSKETKPFEAQGLRVYSDEKIKDFMSFMRMRDTENAAAAMLQQLLNERDEWRKLATARYDVSKCIMQDFQELQKTITTLAEKYCDIETSKD